MLLAVDPGLDNAFAVLRFDGSLELVSEFPAVGEKSDKRLVLGGLPDLINQFNIKHAVVENVGSMPKQGIASSFRFGRAAGAIEGALAAARIPLDLVRPPVWKRYFGTDASGNAMRELAVRQWPKHTERFKLVKHHNRAEAALLGLWWVRKHNA